MLVSCINLKKMERYLRVNLLGPDPRLMKKEFTGPRSHKGQETLTYTFVLNPTGHSVLTGHSLDGMGTSLL